MAKGLKILQVYRVGLSMAEGLKLYMVNFAVNGVAIARPQAEEGAQTQVACHVQKGQDLLLVHKRKWLNFQHNYRSTN